MDHRSMNPRLSFYITATKCISEMDLHWQFDVLPHRSRNCRLNLLPHIVTVHQANQSKHRLNAMRLAGLTLESHFLNSHWYKLAGI